jgi:NTP-dependent ternary system trypsin peptidase co-occuring protein
VGTASKLVKAELPDGTIVWVEGTLSDPEADVSIGKIFSFQGVVDSVRSVADAINTALKEAKPDRASVEFGVDMSVDSGALTGLIVKGTGGATLTIRLEWGAGG